MNTPSTALAFGERARWSIVQEASAIKAGNVHPEASFDDMEYRHFAIAAQSIRNVIEQEIDQPLGRLIESCAQAMLASVGINTSLGTILLLGPLIQYERRHGPRSLEAMLRDDWTGIPILEDLRRASAEDCAAIYRAISSCHPGGLGTRDRFDIGGAAPASILVAMREAAGWDDVALQYVNGFLQVAAYARCLLSDENRSMPLGDAIRRLQITILAQRVDSLIVRKWGMPTGREVQQRAEQVLRSGPYASEAYEACWRALDADLRDRGQRKNPGTTADLIAAALYVASERWR